MNAYKNDVLFHDIKTPLIGNNNNTEDGRPDFELKGYEMAFRQWLREAKDFQQFKQRITEELQRMGFSDWAYSRLDIPLELSTESMVGTPSKEQIKFFSDINYYNRDLTIQHTLDNKSCIYRSSINSFLEKTPTNIEAIKSHLSIVKIYEKFDFYDHFSVPIYRNNKTNHASFSLAAQGKDSKALSCAVKSNTKKLHLLIKLVESVGIEKHPEFFIGKKHYYEKIVDGRAMQLLTLMAKNDFNISEASEAMHMSRTAADKQLAKAREYLNASTTHGALVKAINLGFISLNKNTEKKSEINECC